MKKLILMLALGLAAVMLGGCGQQDAAKPETLKSLTIGVMPDVDSIPLIIAKEQGYFSDEGLAVELKSFKSAMDRDSALQSGNLDGAISDMLAAAFAKSGGFDVKITSLTSGSYKLVAGADAAATTLGDLAGKSVAISKNTIIEYVTDKILIAGAMPSESIDKVVIPQMPTRLEMLQNGQIAAATLPEPLASMAIAKGGKLINSSDQLRINPGVMLFTQAVVTQKPAELAALYRAYNRAVAYLATEAPEQYIDLIIAKGGFPPAVKDCLVLPKYQPAAVPTEQALNECMQWMQEKKLVKQLYTAQDLVDSQFVKK